MTKLREQMRVLIVDDSARDRDLGTTIVESCVEAPSIEYAADYETALPLLLQEYFDLVLLDLSLHEPPGPEESWEGPWLLQDLFERGLNRHVPVVILTNHGTGPMARNLFRNFHIADLWDKQEPRENLVATLTNALVDKKFFGLGCDVDFGDGLSWKAMVDGLGLARRLSSTVSPEDAENELRHIVRKLFSESGRVVVGPLGANSEVGHSGAGVCVVTPFSADGSRQADVVLKYGTFEQISQECSRLTDLRKYMQGFRTTQLENFVLGRQLGALAYSLVGARSGQVRAFSQLYGSASVDQLKRVLRTLFNENFALCYDPKNRIAIGSQNLRELYASYLGFTTESVRQAFEFKYPDKPLSIGTIQFSGVARRFAHPIAALCAGGADYSVESWSCRTHGDLHTGNILVDTSSYEPWLIDFGRSGAGHWARDLVALESSIKFQHVPAKDITALFELEAALVRPDELGTAIHYYREDQPELSKAAELINEVRRLASEISQGTDPQNAMADYYSALFYQTVNYIRLHKLIRNSVRKNQVLLAAAMLYEKLTEVLGAPTTKPS